MTDPTPYPIPEQEPAGYQPMAYPPAGYPPVVAPVPVKVENPTPYHRLFRTARGYAWWRPLVAVAIFLVFVVVAEVVLAIVWFIVVLTTGALDLQALTDAEALTRTLTDVSDPISLVYLLVSVAIMLPLVPLAMLCVGLRPVGLRHSVAFRLRWRWMLWCLIPSLVITIASTALSFLPIAFGEPLTPVPVDPVTFVILTVIILLLVPLQSAAEEYVFRGLILQTMGAWVRNVWPAIVVSTVIFTIGHTQYELWGMLTVGVMGLGFAIVAWRTGGLEAGIALHVTNNLISFIALASGVLGTTEMSSEGSGPLAPIVQAVFTAGYVLWVDRLAVRRRIDRVRALPTAPAL